MFLHSLHDRLGEPQWIETQQFDQQDDRRRSGWLRLVGRRTDSSSRDGTFDLDTDTVLIQGGGDVARWSVLKGQDSAPPDRLHLGLMLGYGKADTDATALGNPARAKGTAEGWSVGGYATWYQNDQSKLGWYTDLWGTYGWFKNSVRGDALPEVKYDANALTLSAEAGYAMRVRDDSDWIVEPQAQVVYVKYSEDDIIEPNGTRIHGGEGSGWIGRLGLRTHRTWVSDSGRKTQPYLTLNWWHDQTDNALAFNTVQLQDMYPSNRYEVKLGVNADLNKGWTGWANLSYLWGSQGYQSISARIGAKYSW
jgi:outer membrane autotransporter protein